MELQDRTKSKTYRIAWSGLLIALAFIFSYVENLVPVGFGVPGIKLGLANLVVLSCIYIMPPAQVFVILVARIVLSGFLFGNMSAILYSLAGGIFSFAFMQLVRRRDIFSAVGVSIIGGVTHNIAQMLIAILIVENIKIAYYFPALIIAGGIAGAIIGVLTSRCLKIWKRYKESR